MLSIGRCGSTLDSEQQRLVTRLRDSLVRRGAKLDAVGQSRLSQINQDLAALFAEFRAKVLADENTCTVIDRESDLAGLPASFISAARVAAEARGMGDRWVIVNTRSSVDPFLTFSSRRDLREAVWRRFKSRATTAMRMTRRQRPSHCHPPSRAREASRFRHHAHWRMVDTMAGDPTAARIDEKGVACGHGASAEDVAEMQAIADREQRGSPIEPWDYLYFAEKVRKAKYDLDQNEVKPYFALENMVAAMMWSAERRFDIAFTEITGRVPAFT